MQTIQRRQVAQRSFLKAGALAILAQMAFFTGPAVAAVHETHSMVDVFNHAPDDALIVLDLDNTTFESAQMLGSNQWLEGLAKALITQGIPAREAFERTSALWEKLQQRNEVKPVQEETGYVIRQRQNKGQVVVALTVRRPEIAKATFRQLKSLKINFDRNLPAEGPMEIKLATPMAHAAHYNRGVIFGGPTNNKGEVLIQFIQKMNLEDKIKSIVFVDDKIKNVEAVHSELTKAGFTVEAYRYAAADEKVKSLDPALAAFQLNFWISRGIILSDFEAKTLMQAGCTGALK